MPSVWRRPERRRLTPCRMVDAIDPARALAPAGGAPRKITPSPCRSGTTSARDCMRGRCSVSTNSPPVKSAPGCGQQDRHLEREHVLAVQVLVQAVVVAGAVLQQQRRRPHLAGGVAARQITRRAPPDSARAMPIASFQRLAIGRERRVERGAQAPRPVPAADRRNTCTRRVRSRGAPSRRGCESASSAHRGSRAIAHSAGVSSDAGDGAAVGVELGRDARPVERGDAPGGSRRRGSAACGRRRNSRPSCRAPRARAARACARRPSGSPTARRRCARRDGRGSRPRADSPHRPARPRAPPSARRCARRSRRSWRSIPAGCRAARCHTRCWNAVPRMSSGRSSPRRRRLDEADHLGDQLLEGLVAADQPRLGEAVLQVAHQSVRIVAEQDRAHALVGCRDQDGAERAFADREADRGPVCRRPGTRSASCREARPRLRRIGRLN